MRLRYQRDDGYRVLRVPTYHCHLPKHIMDEAVGVFGLNSD